ncbi:MAG: hypothetical protein ACTS6A_00680 [Candidatus Hodgkinia cicadicola]
MKSMSPHSFEVLKSNKHLSFSSQARKLILTGLNLASSAVSATMSPKAETL